MNGKNAAVSRSLFRDFLKYTSTNVLSMVGLSLYILADTYFIANGVGEDGLVALNLVLPVYSLMSGTGLMLGVGGAIRYAVDKGRSCLLYTSPRLPVSAAGGGRRRCS